ncbi:hypothetical protein [Streptomyces lydicus]|uniref:hypothetical protein n=1 Tax=Streptomyces lydicus TaxID=47763 RepID=UPI00371E6B3F
MPKLRVHNLTISLDSFAERLLDHVAEGIEGYRVAELVSSSVATHARLVRR